MTIYMKKSDLNALTGDSQPMFSEQITAHSENMNNTFYYSQYYLKKRESETIITNRREKIKRGGELHGNDQL